MEVCAEVLYIGEAVRRARAECCARVCAHFDEELLAVVAHNDRPALLGLNPSDSARDAPIEVGARTQTAQAKESARQRLLGRVSRVAVAVVREDADALHRLICCL
jgi:hypothetical protein